ncbi:hypothetical protein [Hyphomonas adhaerens]|uniref:hypothetical protein n=1 Tax=Hyphomonas adhaerens TaxID=81029 RepID=UPI002355FA7D|nr:hypothetical protein [Hyphomonas adhaerens]
MVIRMIMAALAAGGCVCAATAQEAGSRPDLGPDLGKLYEIRDTVCATGGEVLFLPVSNDMPARETTYAILPADNLDVISAHVVTPQQRAWLIRHGCHSPAARQQVLMDVSTVTPDSGGLDY